MKILVCLIILVTGAAADAFSAETLFSLKSAPTPRIEKSSIASVRESEIVFRTFAIESASSVSFELFDGRTFEAARTGIEIRGFGSYSWHGRLTDGKAANDVLLTFNKGFVSGLIYTATSVFEIVPRGPAHFLVELDHRSFPECGGEVAAEDAGPGPEPVNTLASVDSGDRIDVLVVYTTATKNFLGGDAQAQTLAQQAVEAANLSYFNSRINQRIRMVHSAEYLYTETTSGSTDLSSLRSSAVIQALRETHKADLVAMIGEIQGACGVGYLMGSNQTSGNPNNGFTVTARSCAVGNLSFAHELGHNMGSTHNPENGSGATYPFGYGHWVNGSYRTVMSYVNPCVNGCTRRPYFSNPMVVFSGVPTGIDLARDNARSINLTADAIANYRYSGSNVQLLGFAGGGTLPRGIAGNVTWSSENMTGDVRIEISRDEGTTWQVIVPNTSNDGSESITVWGRAGKRARLRVASVENAWIRDSSTRNVAIR